MKYILRYNVVGIAFPQPRGFYEEGCVFYFTFVPAVRFHPYGMEVISTTRIFKTRIMGRKAFCSHLHKYEYYWYTDTDDG